MLLAVGEGGGGARTPSEHWRGTLEQGSEPPYVLRAHSCTLPSLVCSQDPPPDPGGKMAVKKIK